MRRLLDVCCGAGGAAYGYSKALPGWDITGIDVVPQPHYPFRFIQADALTFPLDGYDAYHCSAPCQRWATATLGQRRRGKVYPDLITPLRARLEATGKPWVMENVPEAPLRADLELCGCMFGLEIEGVGQLLRKRSFELSWRPDLPALPHDHHAPSISIAGHGTPAWQRRITGHVPVAQWRQVMGIDWMTREELTEAIPWAYTQYVGALLQAQVTAR